MAGECSNRPMTTLRFRAVLTLLAGFAATPLLAQSTYEQVDPMIGTGGEGHTFPGAVAPFGMVQYSPDTDTTCVLRACYSHAAGYRYEDPTIQGFSLTHFSGAGHSDLGDVLMMPVAGDTVPFEPGDAGKPGTGYRSRYDHAAEVARPGYYAVALKDRGVRAELTAGTRIGVARYRPTAGAQPMHLLLDLRSSLYNYPARSCGRRSGCVPTASSPAAARRAAGRRIEISASPSAFRCH